VVLVAVETGQAVTTAIWTRLTTDAALQTALGGSVSLYRVMAPQDPAMPYLVHRAAFRGAFHDTHTYLLDVWDYNETPTRVDSAVERIRQLLHEWRFTTAANEASGLLSWFSGGYIPTDAEQVWHFATQWDVRLVAGQDITAIVT
jgi:hypothetical protein